MRIKGVRFEKLLNEVEQKNMITTYSKGLRMYKTEYRGLSAIAETRQKSIHELVKLYNHTINNRIGEL